MGAAARAAADADCARVWCACLSAVRAPSTSSWIGASISGSVAFEPLPSRSPVEHAPALQLAHPHSAPVGIAAEDGEKPIASTPRVLVSAELIGRGVSAGSLRRTTADTCLAALCAWLTTLTLSSVT
jgi:hypothetical protein